MTEDEAKTKVCPVHGIRGQRADPDDTHSPCCIASACMAWRETKPAQRLVNPEELRPAEGFCGLAGVPK